MVGQIIIKTNEERKRKKENPPHSRSTTDYNVQLSFGVILATASCPAGGAVAERCWAKRGLLIRACVARPPFVWLHLDPGERSSSAMPPLWVALGFFGGDLVAPQTGKEKHPHSLSSCCSSFCVRLLREALPRILHHAPICIFLPIDL